MTNKDQSNPSEDKLFTDEEILIENSNEESTFAEAKDSFGVAQHENIIVVNVDNLFVNEDKDDYRVRNRISMKNDPPVLVVKSMSGDEENPIVRLELTEGFTGKMSGILEDIQRSYAGLKPKREMTFKERSSETFANAVIAMKNHPVATGAIGILLVLLILSSIL